MEQRTIKFKAKLVNQNEWVEGDLLHTEDFVFIVWTENGIRRLANVDPSTVCQFTGLKDKNGKEVWEGDYLTPVVFQEIPEEIVFKDGAFGFDISCGTPTFNPLASYAIEEDKLIDLEVIRNKFDRKEEK